MEANNKHLHTLMATSPFGMHIPRKKVENLKQSRDYYVSKNMEVFKVNNNT